MVGTSLRFSTWATQLRRHVAAVGDNVSDLTGSEIEPSTYSTDSNVLTILLVKISHAKSRGSSSTSVVFDVEGATSRSSAARDSLLSFSCFASKISVYFKSI